VLLTEDLRAKLTDFGTARECPELLTGDIVRDEPRGKWHYMVRARVRVGAGARVGGGEGFRGGRGPLEKRSTKIRCLRRRVPTLYFCAIT